MPSDTVFIKRFILRKLIVLGKVGGSHTAIFNLSKGLPNHIRGNRKGQKALKQAIKELINDHFLLSKQSTNETHVSLNPRKINEVKYFLKL